MAEILVEPHGPREFRVRVRDRGLETTHEVVVPEDFGVDNDLPPVPLERLVELSFEFLLEREPANSILARFTLSEIGRYFPQYQGEIAHRLASE
jgi:hypothetical protein